VQAGKTTVVLASDKTVRLQLPLSDPSVTSGMAVTLGIRPEHFGEPGEGEADLEVAVDGAEHLGNTSYIYANLGGDQLIIERPESRSLGKAETLTVSLPAARTFLFDAAGRRLR
jgi:lactose/L-arabinose transport system ATP-binding protein